MTLNNKEIIVAKIVKTHANDAVLLLRADEYAALQALLYELQDKEKLTEIAASYDLELTSTQIARVSNLWNQITHDSIQ